MTTNPKAGGYFAQTLAKKLGISHETLRKRAIAAKINRPPDGGKNYRYPDEDVLVLCEFIEHNVSNEKQTDAARALAAEIKATMRAGNKEQIEAGNEDYWEEIEEIEEEVEEWEELPD